METEIKYWLTDKEREEIFSNEYWNKEEEEKKKDWYILDGNTEKFFRLLREKTTCYEEYESIINFVKGMGLQVKGICVDVAAGVCWITALLSKIEAIDKVYAMEISKHRLLNIAPSVLDCFEASGQKITRVFGSFYDIKLPDQSVDFCFMSQAFHHADEPDRLLSEVRRILKPAGFVLIIGENPRIRSDLLKHYARNLIKMVVPRSKNKNRAVYKLFPSFRELYPPDIELGDNYYRIKDYFHIFKQNGFRLFQNTELHFTNFAAIKE